MSLRLAHELGLALALSLALLSVLVGGELPLLAWLALGFPWLSFWLAVRGQLLPPILGSIMAVLGAAGGGVWLLLRGMHDSLLAAALALLGILGGRLLSRQNMSHDGQALMLSLLCVFAGTVLNQQLTFGLVFVLYAIAATWALVTRQLVAGAAMHADPLRDPQGLARQLARRDVVTPAFFAVVAVVALTILLSSSLLFMAFPRLGKGALSISGRDGGHLPQEVSLLGLPRARQGGGVVARLKGVSYGAFSRGLYLRARMYDQLAVGGFSRSETAVPLRHSLTRLASGPERQRYEVFLQPVTEQFMLTLGSVQQAHALDVSFAAEPPPMRLDNSELLLEQAPTAPMRYRVHGAIAIAQRDLPVPDPVGIGEPAAAAWETAFARQFLRLPDQLDPRILPLANSVVADAHGYAERAARLRSFLLGQFRYALVQDNGQRSDPLAAFLFEDRRGHCEYFATAYAVLLRAVGIPSRVVGGYQGGSWDGASELVVFTGVNAHAWVEWYQPERGWVLDDATPERPVAVLHGLMALLERLHQLWDDDVVGFGLPQQVALLTTVVASLHSPAIPALNLQVGPLLAGLAILTALLAAVVLGLRRHQRQRRDPALAPLTRVLVQALQRILGRPLGRSETLRQASEQALVRLSTQPAGCVLLSAALAIYEASRFGLPRAAAPPGMLLALRRLDSAP